METKDYVHIEMVSLINKFKKHNDSSYGEIYKILDMEYSLYIEMGEFINNAKWAEDHGILPEWFDCFYRNYSVNHDIKESVDIANNTWI